MEVGIWVNLYDDGAVWGTDREYSDEEEPFTNEFRDPTVRRKPQKEGSSEGRRPWRPELKAIEQEIPAAPADRPSACHIIS